MFRIDPKPLVATGLAVALLLPTVAAQAQVVEEWQNRVLDAMREMERVDAQYSTEREQLQSERLRLRTDAAALRAQVKRTSDDRQSRCGHPDSQECLWAKEAAQEAHLGMTENIKGRMEIDQRLLTANAGWSLQLSDVLVPVLEKMRHVDGEGGPANVAAVDDVQRRTEAFLKNAWPALQSAQQYAAVAERTAKTKAKARAAKEVRIAIKKFHRDWSKGLGAGGTVRDRLWRLQTKLAAFGAISRQALAVLGAHATDVRIINALVAAQLAEDMVSLYDGGFTDYGRKFARETEESLRDLGSDIGLLYDSVGAGVEGEGDDDEGFFYDEDEEPFLDRE